MMMEDLKIRNARGREVLVQAATRLPARDYLRLVDIAKERHISIAAMMREAVRGWLDAQTAGREVRDDQRGD